MNDVHCCPDRGPRHDAGGERQARPRHQPAQVGARVAHPHMPVLGAGDESRVPTSLVALEAAAGPV